MSENVIIKMLQEVPKDSDTNTIVSILGNSLANVEKLYSYLVRRKENSYVIQFNLSQIDRYNTLDVVKSICEIVELIINDDGTKGKVLGYNQPSLEIMLEAFEPLINKLAYKQHERWSQLEYEDLCQMCRLVIVRLHRKGYYLHKYIIEKAFNNDVLVSIRHDRDRPMVMSTEDVFYKPASGSSETLLFADIIADTDIELKEYDKNVAEATLLIFEEVKDIVIDMIGIRQWNELFRDYSNKHTTAWSRKTMTKIKNEFEKQGLTRGKFNDKYYK